MLTDQAGNSAVCSTTVVIEEAGADDLVLVAENDTSACDQSVVVDISAVNFDSLGSIQLSLTWNPLVLQLDSVGGFHPDLFLDLNSNFSLNQSGDGILLFNWIAPDPLAGASLPDGSVLFRLYFSGIGSIGSFSGIQFSDQPLVREILDPLGNVIPTAYIGGLAGFIDNQPLMAICPPHITLNAPSGVCDAIYSLPIPTVNDGCSGIGAIGSDHADDHFNAGMTIVTYIVLDNAGNSTTCSVQVTVLENTPPQFITCPTEIDVSATGTECYTAVEWVVPTVTDACNPDSVLLQFTASPGDTFGLGQTLVTYTATDPSGNTAVCSFMIMVQDTVAPVFSNCPADITTQVTNACSAIVSWIAPAAGDNCDQNLPAITSNYQPGVSLPAGVHFVQYEATDTYGNAAFCSFSVTVTETEPPVLSNCPPSQTVFLPQSTCDTTLTWSLPVAADNCELDTLFSNVQPGGPFQPGTTLVMYTARDVTGNESTCSFELNVVDQAAPELAGCPKDTVLVGTGNCGATLDFVLPTATDNCDQNPLITASAAPGDTFPVGLTLVKIYAKDTYGNIDSCQFQVEVSGEGASFGNIPPSQVLNGCEAVVTWQPPVVFGFCGNVQITSTHAPGDTFPLGTTTVVYTAVDDSGASVSASFSITVADQTIPQFDCPEGPVVLDLAGRVSSDPDLFVLLADPDSTCSAIEMTFTPPPAYDNCGTLAVEQLAGQGPGALLAAGKHQLHYRATDGSGNTADCVIDIEVSPLLPPGATVQPAIACPEDTVRLSVPFVPGVSYAWTDPQGSLVADTALQFVIDEDRTGYYTLQAKIYGCLTPIDSVLVQLAYRPEATDDLEVTADPGERIQFNVLPNDVFIPGDGTITDISPLNGLVYKGEGDFEYAAGQEFGYAAFIYKLCSAACPDLCDLATVNITVQDSKCAYVPNVLTPNGDGINDHLEIPCLDTGLFPENELVIYNQWGDRVFDSFLYSNDPARAWRGTFFSEPGKNLPDGTYFYVFRPAPGAAAISGFIEIFR